MSASASSRLRRMLGLKRPRMTRRRAISWSVVGVLIIGLIVWAAWPASHRYRSTSAMITVMTGPNGDVPVSLDTTYYMPTTATASHPVPAVLLAHGFGGTKDSVVDQAEDLADRGYAVMTWTAEGFGRSGGQIHLDSPDWEVKDAQQLIDWLARRPEVAKDASGDPRVAAVGGSYGGGLALLLAAYDARVDAVVPSITWNNLANAFLPDATSAGAARTGAASADPGAPKTGAPNDGAPQNGDGVFKKAWAGLFFGESGGAITPGTLPSGIPTGAIPSSGIPTAPGGAGATPNGDDLAQLASCGRFAADVCAAYQSLASTGQATPSAVALLERSSPASVIDRIKAPTLLIQGEADSLFPLSEANANARGIEANGTPVKVAWFTGGHDGGSGPQSDQDRINELTDQWLDHYLKKTGPAPNDDFTYSRVAGLDTNDNGVVALGFKVPAYPGLSGQSTANVALIGPPQPAANPPGGVPAALSTLPGTGASVVSTLARNFATDIPGQHADFYSRPLDRTIDVVGAPTAQIRVASPTGTATVFVKLYDVDPNSGLTLPNGLVAPVRLTGLSANIADAAPITVTLPGIVHRFESGHVLRLTVATSDQGFSTPSQPTVYTVALGGSGVTLPSVASTQIATSDVAWRWALVALIVALAVGVALTVVIARRRSRRKGIETDREYADTPLVVRGLRKEYGDGFVAVSTLDLTVRRGQVLGLLGPNGAGKTTTLRVLMGLTQPTAGEIFVFGHPLSPGSPVLSRLGALVEGPGFLPHLSGRENLRLYWRSTGRPEADARMDEALEIAGLGGAIDRRVKTYSHGMRQRLAIAQAMLGLPELLVLDEPTDGLDPPQIAEMRRVLRRYATDGRAVLVSSHLLAEVEQTCTHVVVMHQGQKVADGPVDDIVGESPSVQFDVDDPDRALTLLEDLSGIRSAARDGAGLVVDIDGTPRADVVAALVRAGIGVDRVAPRRRLEDAFLSLVGGDTKASGERPGEGSGS